MCGLSLTSGWSVYRKCALMAIDDACNFLKGGGEVAVSVGTKWNTMSL